jgi:DNA polymerase I-like protein with 3'-5' exonuclease and polymerase domains
MMRRAQVDFETDKIEEMPFPPKPVGVAIHREGEKRGRYLRWGHRGGGNNCTKEQAARELKDTYDECHVSYHNAPFDIDVGSTHLKLKRPKSFGCTMTLGFLNDPRAESLGLKEQADALLNIRPKEQDKLRQWILEHILAAKKKPKEWGAYIAEAPGNMVEPYAIGDISRTDRLERFLLPRIIRTGMADAYQRELRLMPVLLKMTHKGLPIARKKLERDLETWEKDEVKRDEWIRRRLRAPGLDIDKDRQLAAALDRAGVMGSWIMTSGGKSGIPQKSVAMPALKVTLNDRELFTALQRRSIMSTYMNTFARNWLRLSEPDGHLHVTFNGTRRDRGDGGKMGGTRTGRLSCSYLQNTPKPSDLTRALGLPNMRSYIVPETGMVIFVRDYDQQEFRIFAHFEDADAREKYLEDPHLDFHDMAGTGVNRILASSNKASLLKLPLERKPIKNLGFGILYGQGLGLTAERMEVDVKTAKLIRDIYFTMLPGIKTLQQELMDRGHKNEPIKTWGGRVYYVEPGKFINGRFMDFSYKLLNLLIQGSAAECTKEGMIRADNAGVDLRLQVHDELLAMAARGDKRAMAQLREAMESIEFDVPMLSSAKQSRESWGELEKFKEEIWEKTAWAKEWKKLKLAA